MANNSLRQTEPLQDKLPLSWPSRLLIVTAMTVTVGQLIICISQHRGSVITLQWASLSLWLLKYEDILHMWTLGFPSNLGLKLACILYTSACYTGEFTVIKQTDREFSAVMQQKDIKSQTYQ